MKRLSPSDFNVAIEQLQRIGERPAELAKAVLVDGLSPANAGRLYGVSRQAAQRAANKVYSAWVAESGGRVEAAVRTAESLLAEAMKAEGFPDNWVPTVAPLPKNIAAVVHDVERRQVRKLHGG